MKGANGKIHFQALPTIVASSIPADAGLQDLIHVAAVAARSLSFKSIMGVSTCPWPRRY